MFTQWRSDSQDVEVIDDNRDKRTLTEANLVSAASNLNLCSNFKSKSNFKASSSLSNMRTLTQSASYGKRKGSNHVSDGSKGNGSLTRSDSLSSLPVLYDSGLFEAAKFANPVLPQYHPKLLMELLNFGKTKRVKAILAHLVRCISGSDGVQTIYSEDHVDNGVFNVQLSRQRSVSARSEKDIDLSSMNYVEIKSIPPLPLYALIAADKDNSSLNSEITAQKSKEADYNDLLSPNILKNDDDDIDFLSTSADSNSSNPRRGRLHSGGNKATTDPHRFTSVQANILREYLFKLNLPGLSGNDQFYLAALAEVVGSTTLEFSNEYDGMWLFSLNYSIKKANNLKIHVTNEFF